MVCAVVKDFFVNGQLLNEINATVIALVPKLPTPKMYLIIGLLHVVMWFIK